MEEIKGWSKNYYKVQCDSKDCKAAYQNVYCNSQANVKSK